MDLLEMNGGKFVFIGGRWWLVMVDSLLLSQFKNYLIERVTIFLLRIGDCEIYIFL